MSLKVYINGELVPQEDAKVSVFDHGLLYGDGIFEGIRSYNGNVFKLTAHVDRLYDSAKALDLKIPITKDVMRAAVKDTLAANNLKDGYVRLVVTRGVGKLGLDPYKCDQPQVIIIADTIALYPNKFYVEGLEVVTVATIRNHPEAVDPRIKSMNYINNILAKIECINAGAMEAVMLNRDGFVAECTGDNIFIVKGGIIYTPPAYAGILKGITRDVVIELALEKGIVVREDLFTRYDLYVAEECFLTGTAAELIPVVKIDGRPVGPGKPGRVTMDLLKSYQQLTRSGVAG